MIVRLQYRPDGDEDDPNPETVTVVYEDVPPEVLLNVTFELHEFEKH